MKVHFHANQYVGRAYKDDRPIEKLFKDEADWQESMLIQITGTDAWISAAQKDFGETDRLDMKEVFSQTKEFLRSIGIKRMRWQGNGRIQTEILEK